MSTKDRGEPSVAREAQCHGRSHSATPTGAVIARALRRAGCQTRLDGPEHAAILLDGVRVTRLSLHETVRPQTLRAILRTLGVAPEQFAALLEDGAPPPATLGDILFADGTPAPRESEWVALVRSVAARDPNALCELYRRMHDVVFTLLLRIGGERDAAARLTPDVFLDVWRHAPHYDATNGSVVGWVMNQTRTRAMRPNETIALGEQARLLRHALAALDGDDWNEPPWKQATPGLLYQVLAADAATHVVSMRVRLEPGVEYPSHVHAAVEELHVLEGELWIDDRKLHPGDYNRAEAGTGDRRVWSETGCACVLVTSHRDLLRLSA